MNNGHAATVQELADALRGIDRAITSPRENATLVAAADRLVTLERELADERLVSQRRFEALTAALDDRDEARSYAEESARLVKSAEVILGLWSETELDPEDDDYENFMAAFSESVTGFLREARAALAKNPAPVLGVDVGRGDDKSVEVRGTVEDGKFTITDIQERPSQGNTFADGMRRAASIVEDFRLCTDEGDTLAMVIEAIQKETHAIGGSP